MRPNVMSLGQSEGRRIVDAHQSPFFFAVRTRDWEEVLRRSRQRPQELDLQDNATGNTLLHEACRLDPPAEVIRALQSTCRVKNLQGATPLHIAASHRCSAEALGVLLDVAARTLRGSGKETPPTADLSNMGRAPIHYACMSFRGLEIDAFMMLLDATLKEGFVELESDERLLGFDEYIDEGLDEDIDYEDYQPPSFDDIDKEKVIVNVMSLKDSSGQTPLAALFRRYRQRVRRVISTVDRLRSENENAPDQAALASAMTVHSELGELWEKARRIVARLTEERLQREGVQLEEGAEHQVYSPGACAERQEAASWAVERHRGGNPSEHDVLPVYVDAENQENSSPIPGAAGGRRQFRIVHASVGLIGYGCPPEMIRLAVAIYPHQVREMDEDGNLPLHIAVKASSYLQASHSSLAAALAAASGDASDDLSVLSDAMSFFSSATISQTSNPFDKVIKILLQHHPEGARIPQGETGQLPLVLAIESGLRTWEDGIRSLLNAYPPALHNRKVIEPELYPYLLAQVTRGTVISRLMLDDLHAALSEDDFFATTENVLPRISSKKRRHDACARTTLFQLLRAKPEWLTAEGRELEHNTHAY